MTKPTVTIELVTDADSPLECEFNPAAPTYRGVFGPCSRPVPDYPGWLLQAFTPDDTHIGETWTCTNHIARAYDALIEKAAFLHPTS